MFVSLLRNRSGSAGNLGSTGGRGVEKESNKRIDRVDLKDLGWEDKERVLRLLFAKINQSQGQAPSQQSGLSTRQQQSVYHDDDDVSSITPSCCRCTCSHANTLHMTFQVKSNLAPFSSEIHMLLQNTLAPSWSSPAKRISTIPGQGWAELVSRGHRAWRVQPLLDWCESSVSTGRMLSSVTWCSVKFPYL